MKEGKSSGSCLKDGLSHRSSIEKGSGLAKPGPTGRPAKEAKQSASKGGK